MYTELILGKTRRDAEKHFRNTWPNRVIQTLRIMHEIEKNKSGESTYQVSWTHRRQKPNWI